MFRIRIALCQLAIACVPYPTLSNSTIALVHATMHKYINTLYFSLVGCLHTLFKDEGWILLLQSSPQGII